MTTFADVLKDNKNKKVSRKQNNVETTKRKEQKLALYNKQKEQKLALIKEAQRILGSHFSKIIRII